MQSYIEYINESKQVGIIYHYTNLQNFFSIINDNSLKSTGPDAFNEHFISFTRNKNLHKNDNINTLYGMTISLIIDGDKLSNNYKIEPIDYFSKNKKVQSFRGTNKYPDEDEERAVSNKKFEIKPLLKYLNGIYVIETNLEKQIIKMIEIYNKKMNKKTLDVSINNDVFEISLNSIDEFKNDFFEILDKNKIKYKII